VYVCVCVAKGTASGGFAICEAESVEIQWYAYVDSKNLARFNGEMGAWGVVVFVGTCYFCSQVSAPFRGVEQILVNHVCPLPREGCSE
jgi:hypothetical protein